MQTRGHKTSVDVDVGDIKTLRQSFRRTLLAENKSPATVAVYTSAVDRFADFLEAGGMPTAVASVRREHVEAFIADLLSRRAPATAANRYRALQVFFGWLTEEGEITASPMANMKPPHVPEVPSKCSPRMSSSACSRPVRAEAS